MDELEQPAETLDSEAAAAAAEDQHDDQQHDDQTDPDSQEQAEEDEEIEIGGKKVAMPKSIAAEIKAGTMRNADYTQKTQAVAEERKAVQAEREQARQEREQSQQYIKEVAKVHALDDQLAEFNKVDWSALSQSDPGLAQQLDFQRRDLERKRAEADEAITKVREQNALAEQQATAKQIQEAEAYVQREIPGWTPELGAKLNSFAAAQGVKFDQSFAKALIANPALIKVMHKAEMFDQLEKKQSTKAKPPAPPPAPVTRVSAARASAAKDPDKMPMDDWVKWRNSQRGKR